MLWTLGYFGPMGQVTSLFVRKMLNAASDRIDATSLLAQVGIDAQSPPDPKLKISDTAYYDLLERIAEEIDPTDLPLKVGASMRCDDYGALGLAFKAATTLQGAFERVVRYARLWTDVVDYTLVPDGQATWFQLHRSGPRRLGLRLSNEATLASAAAIAAEVSPTGRFSPLEVHFAHPAPKTLQHHTEYFGCPVVFDAGQDAMLIANERLSLPNRLGDRGITEFLIGHLEQEIAALAPAHVLRDRLRDAIARALSNGAPSMEDTARRLGMSTRSLHRKLADDGLNFQTLTTQTRAELAEGLLRDARYSLAEVAFLTGFAEQSSFTRAFKRWFGETPGSFRRRVTA